MNRCILLPTSFTDNLFILLSYMTTSSHYHIERKRAAVAVFNEVDRIRTQGSLEQLTPLHLASVASGGASRTQIYAWRNEDLSEHAQEMREETRGGERVLTEAQEMLLVGFAISERSALNPVVLRGLSDFCSSYLTKNPSLPTISRIMADHGLSSQRTMTRASRLTTAEVVEDALSNIEVIRSYNFPPDRLLFMDETGLWSNVTQLKTYNFTNWYANIISLIQ
jgi:hypothetical protein